MIMQISTTGQGSYTGETQKRKAYYIYMYCTCIRVCVHVYVYCQFWACWNKASRGNRTGVQEYAEAPQVHASLNPNCIPGISFVAF